MSFEILLTFGLWVFEPARLGLREAPADHAVVFVCILRLPLLVVGGWF